MKIKFKLILGLLGLFTFNFWGGVIGFIIGSVIDSFKIITPQNFKAHQQKAQSSFFIITFQVLGHISKAKGLVTTDDIKKATSMMDQLKLQGEARVSAQRAFNEGKAADFPLKQALYTLRTLTIGNPNLRYAFIEFQIQAALVDGTIHPNEARILGIIKDSLNISDTIFDSLLNRSKYWQNSSSYSSRDELGDAYEILQVSPKAEEAEIKKSYRKLMSENHPDKAIAKGLPPEMIEIAKQKTQSIQGAYEIIKKSRGF